MYFHPFILTEAQQQQSAAAYHEFAQLYLDGLDRQLRLHSDAVSDYCAKQQESLRELARSTDPGEFVWHCFAYPAPTPLELLRISIRSGEIAAEVQRQVIAVMDRHAEALVRDVAGGLGDSAAPKFDNRVRERSRRQQRLA